MSGGDEPEVDDVKVGSLVEGKNSDNDCSINGNALKKQVAMPTEELRNFSALRRCRIDLNLK